MAGVARTGGRVRGGVIAVSLLAGVYVLVLLVAGGSVAVAVWAVATFPAYAVSKLLVLVGVVLVVLMGAVLRSLRIKRVVPWGVEMTPAEQPRLWATVAQLAAAVGTRPPDEIRLDERVNAVVHEDLRWLGLRGGRRTLYIGAPVLVGMPVGELTAVLGHELGHYSGRHLAFARVSIRGGAALRLVIVGMDLAVVRKVFEAYARLYFTVSAGIDREQEQEADRVAIAVTGRRQTQSALRRMARMGPAWELATKQYGPLAKSAHRSPDLFAAYSALLVEPGRQAQYEEAVEAELARPSDRYDGHPGLRDRLAAASAVPDSGVPMDATAAATLVAHLPQTLQRLQDQILRTDLGPPAAWPELVALAARRRSANDAGELVRVAAPGRTDVTLGQLLDGVAGGHGARMVGPLVNPGLAPDDRPVAFRAVCTQLLAACVTSTLIESGLAGARVNWAGPQPWEVVGASGAVVDVEALVAPAVAAAMPDAGRGSPHGVAMLREQLSGMGVPLDRPISPVDHDPLAPDLVAVLLNMRLDKAFVDALVCDTGLLLVRQSRWNRPSASQPAVAQRKVNRRRLRKILARPMDELRAAEGNRFIGTHDIVAARVERRGWLTRVDLQLADGSAARLSTTVETQELDGAWSRLHQLLGARLHAA